MRMTLEQTVKDETAALTEKLGLTGPALYFPAQLLKHISGSSDTAGFSFRPVNNLIVGYKLSTRGAGREDGV